MPRSPKIIIAEISEKDLAWQEVLVNNRTVGSVWGRARVTNQKVNHQRLINVENKDGEIIGFFWVHQFILKEG